jgi:hypothetical protein
MLTAFQIILFVVIVIGLMGVIGEKEDKNLRNNMAWICISAMMLVFLTMVLL